MSLLAYKDSSIHTKWESSKFLIKSSQKVAIFGCFLLSPALMTVDSASLLGLRAAIDFQRFKQRPIKNIHNRR
jgi:hypothetical protein